MSRYEPDTGAWVYDGPTEGVCSECGAVAVIGEDGVCPRCLVGEPVLETGVVVRSDGAPPCLPARFTSTSAPSRTSPIPRRFSTTSAPAVPVVVRASVPVAAVSP